MTARWRERWPVPPVWWVATLAVAGLVAAELDSGYDGSGAWLLYPLLLGSALLALAWVSRHQVRVEDGSLHVPRARAPVAAFGDPEVLDRDSLRLWRGPRAHRDAWVQVRPWHRAAVRLPVTDPEDETPYWLIGSRRPERLAAAVRDSQPQP